MRHRVTLGDRGGIEVPAVLREKCRLMAGDPLTIERTTAGLLLRPAETGPVAGDPPPDPAADAVPPPAIDLLLVGGSPGSGKSTLCRHLWRRWDVVPSIDFGSLRILHLDPGWTRANPAEEAMSFDHLTYLVRSYVAHGYRPVIVDDLQHRRITDAATAFAGLRYQILTLFATDDTITTRIRSRGEGFTNVDVAVDWNRHVRDRPTIPHELKLDTTGLDPVGVAAAAGDLLRDTDV